MNPAGRLMWYSPTSAARMRRSLCRTAGSGSGSAVLPAGVAGPVGRVAGRLEDLLELRLVVAQQILGLLDGDVAAADQFFGVDLADRRLPSMIWYIRGLVIDGSSPSLWPRLR